MNHPYRFLIEKTFLSQVIGYYVDWRHKWRQPYRGHYSHPYRKG